MPVLSIWPCRNSLVCGSCGNRCTPFPKPGTCPDGWSCIRHRLAMLSYAMLNPDHNYSDPSLLKYVGKFREKMAINPHDPAASVELVCALAARQSRT